MFDLADLTPHGFCLAWDPGLIWLQAVSDLLIAGAYYSIPFALLRLTRLRQDLAFPWMFRLFAGFILACGTTHVFSVITLWLPVYWMDGALKALTAVLSVGTAAILWPLLPKALAIPTQSQLTALNERLLLEVAERRAAEGRLRASEARLKSIYACSPAPLCAADGEGRLMEVSNQWLELLGYERDEVTGRALQTFHAPDTSEMARQHWEELLRSGGLREVEQTLLHRDGSRRQVVTSARLDPGDSGSAALAISAMTDVTGRREMEAALRESEAHLRQAQKMEAVGHLTGGIAHDFNNMLTSITVVMELLQRRMTEQDPSRKLVGSVLDVAGRAAKLTAQLLAFSRRQRLVAEPLDPLEVAESMRLLLTQPLGEQVVLDIGRSGGYPWRCLADRSQLEAGLLNLVLNARAAISDKGRISIEVAPLAHVAADELDLKPGEDVPASREYLAITVADNGCGMPDEVRRQAFEPFFTTKPVGQGSGLGLSQLYGFARQSGGTARIESTPGEGTRVTIVLPRSDQAPAADAAGSSGSLEYGRGERLLVVEDEDTLRDVLVAALQDRGYRVTSARMAEEALQVLEAGEPIDLLFTDVVMPGGTGVDLAVEVRNRIPGLPVLFATGYSDRKILDRWPGQLRLLAKPYSIDTVVAAIHAALTGRGPDPASRPAERQASEPRTSEPRASEPRAGIVQSAASAT